MKISLIAVVLSFLSSIAAAGELRLLLHGSSSEGPGWKISGWAICPSVTDDSGIWVATAGPRLNWTGGWLETHLGAVFADDKTMPLVELRPFVKLGENGYVAGLARVVDPLKSTRAFVSNLQVGYDLPGALPTVGLDADPVWSKGADSVPIGPHVTTSFGQMLVQALYHWDLADGEDSFRVRVGFTF